MFRSGHAFQISFGLPTPQPNAPKVKFSARLETPLAEISPVAARRQTAAMLRVNWWLCRDAATPAQYTSTSTAAFSADFTTSANWRGWVDGSFNLADTTPITLPHRVGHRD